MRILLLAALLLAALPAHAGMIETQQLLAPPAEARRAQVDAFLAREDVRRELQAYGVSPADAAARVASLSEAEVQELSSRIDSLPAAGGNIGLLELLLIILIIVLLV